MKLRRASSRILFCIFLILPLQACYYLQAADAPIRTLFFPQPGSNNDAPSSSTLVLLLPGIRDYPEYFQQHEFIDLLHASGAQVDVVAVNAHYRYYSRRNLLMRLKEDVIEPARARGYRQIHFVGVSMGGYGSLLYMREYPEDVSSVTLLAPYLGEPEHYRHLLQAHSEPVAGVMEDAANIWPWLLSLDAESQAKIQLGYGRADSYVESQRLLSNYLPVANVMVVEGGHRWTTWQVLWERLLAKARFADSIAVLGSDGPARVVP